MLAQDAASKNFVSDAFGHCKFIGFNEHAGVLFEQARIPPELDDGSVPINQAKDGKTFVHQCRTLRFWPREVTVDLDAASLTASPK